MNAAANALRTWLILLTLAALLAGGLAVIFGLLINMETEIEMNPNGDAAVRQDAIGLRLFAWSAAAAFVFLLAAGVVGGWRARKRQRPLLAIGLSLIAAVPIFLAAAAFLYFMLKGSS